MSGGSTAGGTIAPTSSPANDAERMVLVQLLAYVRAEPYLATISLRLLVVSYELAGMLGVQMSSLHRGYHRLPDTPDARVSLATQAAEHAAIMEVVRGLIRGMRYPDGREFYLVYSQVEAAASD